MLLLAHQRALLKLTQLILLFSMTELKTCTPVLTELGYQLENLYMDYIVRKQADKFEGKTFLHWIPTMERWSYRDLETITSRLAVSFQDLGWTKGKHVAVLMGNSPLHLFSVIALARAGLVAVPINTASKGALLTYYLNQSDSAAIIVDAELLNRLDAVDPEVVQRLSHIVLCGAEAADLPSGALSLESLAESAVNPIFVSDARPWDLAFLAYTSGTTGPSKGNMLSQAAALNFGLSNAEHHGYVESDVLYVCLPLFHVAGLMTATFGALLTGMSVGMTSRFSSSGFLADIEECQATVTNLLGSLCNFLWCQSPSERDKTTLRMVSAVPVPKYALEFEQRFGLKITSGYGLSDHGMVAAYTPADAPSKMGSSGRARRHYAVRIVDDNDIPLPPNSIGEILARVDIPWLASTGYYNMPAETLKANRNNWFHTGDIGYLDEDGYLFFTDRKKDAIRRRGENISAFEVEQIICTHPLIVNAVVYPVDAGGADDEVAVSVIRRCSSLTERDIVRFCSDNMAYYMVPRFISFSDQFPTTGTGKVQKHVLRSSVQADIGRIWDREKEGIQVRR